MKVYSAYIVDDERLARDGLRKKLENYPEIEVIGEGSNIPSAIKGIENLNPEILFLDIQLSDGTGFDLINKIDYNGKIIFVTAYDEFALRAFEINALDYLMKPISEERLESAISRIKSEEQEIDSEILGKLKYDDRVMVSTRNSIHFIEIKNIIVIEASGDYTFVQTSEGKRYLTTKSMQEWEKRLPDQHFMRIHRSYIVNFSFIEKTDKHAHHTALIFLKGLKDPVKISRSYYKKIKDRYM